MREPREVRSLISQWLENRHCVSTEEIVKVGQPASKEDATTHARVFVERLEHLPPFADDRDPTVAWSGPLRWILHQDDDYAQRSEVWYLREGAWIASGRGDAMLLRFKDTRTVRFLMRQDGKATSMGGCSFLEAGTCVHSRAVRWQWTDVDVVGN